MRNLIRRVLPDDLANVARVLREERDALHARGATTEGRDWRPRIEQLLDLERD